MVSPAAIRESSTPTARPLKTCDMNRPRLGILTPPLVLNYYWFASGGGIHLAAGIIMRWKCFHTIGNGDDIDKILVVFDVFGGLAPNNREVGGAVMVFGTEVDIATHGVRALVIDAVFQSLDHGSRVEGTGTLDGI